MALTGLCVACVIGGTPVGRYSARRLAIAARQTARAVAGLPPSRAEIDADWRLRRERGVAHALGVFRRVYDEAEPRWRSLLDDSGLDPDHAVVRWGNYDKIFVLPSAVFTPDDLGLSYRMRPRTRSVWLRGVYLPRNLDGFFLVPDTPELPGLIAGTGAYIVEGSAQTTNSWGLRGPEPDLDAPVRGLVLGDSNMQGLFVGDDEAPPACLQRELSQLLHARVALLNTGVLGYSPEQFYHSLVKYTDHFRPHFVLLTLCPNDVGDGFATLNGQGDWDEASYWIGAIQQHCRTRNLLLVTSPLPVEMQITGVRAEGFYPGLFCNLCHVSGILYCNPIEDFVDEHLRLRNDFKRADKPFPNSPLYNGHLSDYHFSARGTALWGRALGRRLALLLETMRLNKRLDF